MVPVRFPIFRLGLGCVRLQFPFEVLTRFRNVSGLTTDADYLLPYYLNYLGGEESYNKSQCLCAGANNWIPTHQAMNNGHLDMWAQVDTAQAWGYHMRQDIPFHYALADAYTVGDAYHVKATLSSELLVDADMLAVQHRLQHGSE